ncbi:MAG: LON peptidase substrate-binding domain-containing protein [Bryobacterales bacterium]|nr:LON peptidase substrate-binding domain-containing protein [Bryobacterales bacterium]
MPVDLLPLFPLNAVALPGAALPLHIFEDRYKEMIGIAIQQQTEFGIVLSHEQGIANIGCSVLVETVMQRHDDGRMDILCRGSRRFEIVQLNEEKDYLRATVQFFDDDESDGGKRATDELRAATMDAWRFLAERVAEGPIPDLDADDPRISFELGQTVGDVNLRQVLLQMRSEAERLQHLLTYFRTFETRQARIAEARRLAPTNGHAKSSIAQEEQ